jgi:hypothetical protein
MGDVAMGKCKNGQWKSYITQTNCKHSKGGYGRLPLSDVYTCHGFFQRPREFEEVNSIMLFHKLNQWFVDNRFSNFWQPTINRIYKTSKTTLCNSR